MHNLRAQTLRPRTNHNKANSFATLLFGACFARKKVDRSAYRVCGDNRSGKQQLGGTVAGDFETDLGGSERGVEEGGFGIIGLCLGQQRRFPKRVLWVVLRLFLKDDLGSQ